MRSEIISHILFSEFLKDKGLSFNPSSNDILGTQPKFFPANWMSGFSLLLDHQLEKV